LAFAYELFKYLLMVDGKVAGQAIWRGQACRIYWEMLEGIEGQGTTAITGTLLVLSKQMKNLRIKD
jgi:hypothetical protein